jgi:hypothetical protein
VVRPGANRPFRFAREVASPSAAASRPVLEGANEAGSFAIIVARAFMTGLAGEFVIRPTKTNALVLHADMSEWAVFVA